MRIALFGGSFDPFHREHAALVRAAQTQLCLDKTIVIPAGCAPHKAGAHADGGHRMQMCRIACRDLPGAEADDFEVLREGKSFTYLTCRAFRARYPDAELFFLMGADMLDNFFTWKNPEDIVRHVKIAACGRDAAIPKEMHDRFRARFGCDFVEISYTGAAVSSTALRVALAFAFLEPKELGALDENVLAYLQSEGLYAYPDAVRGLLLEEPKRQWHSYRVARLACMRARSLKIDEEKALVAAMLHDCGKYVPLSSPLLAGFTPPGGVPAPVMHQYTGAYLAKTYCAVSDGEILSAIACHTSGKPDMVPLDKLLFLADLLEEDRAFEGVDALRRLFWEDLDKCLEAALSGQIAYLEGTGKPVYPLTRAAYEFLLKS